MIINNNKLVVITEPKTTNFDLTIDVKNSLEHETDFIKKHKEFLASIQQKTRLLSKYKHVNDIHEHRKQ